MSDRAADPLSRRSFALALAAVGASGRIVAGRPPVVRVHGPKVTCGVASGDVTAGSAVVWSRSDRPARMVVEWATNDAFRDARRLVGPIAGPESDFTARAVLTGLPPGETIVYRVRFRDPDSAEVLGEPVVGRLRTPPAHRGAISFCWGGDVCGQGWGIDRSRGGMATFDVMKKLAPDFFLHSGDHIYADNPILPEVLLEDGSTWRNVVTDQTSKVAETLDEFRGRYRYLFLDDAYRAFAASVPTLDQWDDHEVLNNWYPGEVLDTDPRYQVKDVNTLVTRARRAFFDYLPIRPSAEDAARIYRSIPYGPNLEVFLLDQRSYRGPNGANRDATPGPGTTFLGEKQHSWLKGALKRSRATWKIIASDMPIGLVIPDGPGVFEGIANGDGPPLGREREIADLLSFLKANAIRNVVWLTADIHYAAAHIYDPARARFTDFEPFREFIAGPLHAGNFGPNPLDPTFGPRVDFSTAKPGNPANRPPSDGLQFFGRVQIEENGRTIRVSLHDRSGREVYQTTLPASEATY